MSTKTTSLQLLPPTPNFSVSPPKFIISYLIINVTCMFVCMYIHTYIPLIPKFTVYFPQIVIE